MKAQLGGVGSRQEVPHHEKLCFDRRMSLYQTFFLIIYVYVYAHTCVCLCGCRDGGQRTTSDGALSSSPPSGNRLSLLFATASTRLALLGTTRVLLVHPPSLWRSTGVVDMHFFVGLGGLNSVLMLQMAHTLPTAFSRTPKPEHLNGCLVIRE